MVCLWWMLRYVLFRSVCTLIDGINCLTLISDAIINDNKLTVQMRLLNFQMSQCTFYSYCKDLFSVSRCHENLTLPE